MQMYTIIYVHFIELNSECKLHIIVLKNITNFIA